MPSKVQHVDGVISLEGKEGVVLASDKGGLSFVAPGKDSYLVLDTKNLAILKAGKNSVALYEDDITGGMIDIQADTKGAINLAVQDGSTQNTALTITDGKAHVGVFNAANFDRLHVESGKVTLESSVGPVAGSTALGKVEVKPDEVLLSSLKSVMKVGLDGFEFSPAANTIALKLTTKEFSVVAKNGTALKIDLITGKVEIKALMVEIESSIETKLKTLENTINTNIKGIKTSATTMENRIEAIQNDQTIVRKTDIQALEQRVAQLEIACWVARAVFGETDIRWRLFRHWLFGDRFHPEQATWLQRSYLRHGLWVAEVVRRCPPLRWALYLCMSHCIRGLHAVPHGAFGRASVSPPLSLSLNL